MFVFDTVHWTHPRPLKKNFKSKKISLKCTCNTIFWQYQITKKCYLGKSYYTFNVRNQFVFIHRVSKKLQTFCALRNVNLFNEIVINKKIASRIWTQQSKKWLHHDWQFVINYNCLYIQLDSYYKSLSRQYLSNDHACT